MAWETKLCQLDNVSGQLMEMVTANLCVAVVSIDRRSNDEIISLDATHLVDGPSKCTRKSMKKVIEVSPRSIVEDLLDVANTSKDITKATKELV